MEHLVRKLKDEPISSSKRELWLMFETDVSLIYFSNVTGNTKKFMDKLKFQSERIPIKPQIDELPLATQPYVLVIPTYGNGEAHTAVPPQVKKFLNVEQNRNFLRGVIASGNLNFGKKYGRGGEVVSRKCNVPLLFKFELLGTTEDVRKVEEGLEKFWSQIAQ